MYMYISFYPKGLWHPSEQKMEGTAIALHAKIVSHNEAILDGWLHGMQHFAAKINLELSEAFDSVFFSMHRKSGNRNLVRA